MKKFNPDKTILREFGITMVAAFLVISGLFFFRHKDAGAVYSLAASCAFFITGLALPGFLRTVYIAWMRLAVILSWINTRIILGVLFYVVFTPAGLVMRLFRIDLLERKEKKETYWRKKEKIDFNPSNYERRF